MTLTLKGRIIIVLLLLLVLGGGGLYLYSWFTGKTLEEMWRQLTARSAGEPVQQSSGPSDAEIKAQLYETLFRQADLRKQNITITVSNGVVSFSGEVDAPQHKAALDQIGQHIAGIKQVVNNVTVNASSLQPVSEQTTGQDLDQQLAKRVEFALYETDAFELKLMTVTTQNGQVRLSGAVRNVAEKLLAKRIVKEVPGVTEVVDELTIQPVPSPATP